jgi:putative transposase
MPWKETYVMDERLSFVKTYSRKTVSLTELCDEFGISRKTGYKWLVRYEKEGLLGLEDRRSTPHSHPAKMPDDALQRCIKLKQEKPHWGPKKLVVLGKTRRPDLYWPVASTLGEYFKRLGLVKPRRWRNRSVLPYEADLIEAKTANEVWCADFKGQFHTGDKKYCYPLTVTDAHSRYILSCHALPDVGGKGTRPVFEQLFQCYGLPHAIRTDNGPPFATLRLGFSHLSFWWMKLGIVHERIVPGHPEQNGRHERMHKTLKAETTRPPKRNMAAQQRRFDEWREEFNQERPHEALGMATPATRYSPSTRSYPEQLPEVSYPQDFEIRRVRQSGEILWRNRLLYMGTILIGERIGLAQLNEERWQIWFSDVPIGILDERLKKVLPLYPV